MTEGKIYAQMTKVMKNISAIGKDQRNHFHKWRFRGIDDVYNAMHPLLSENDIFCACEVLSMDKKEYENVKKQNVVHATFKYRYKFYTTDGSFVATEAVGEAIDTNGDKASSKCASISHKYALLQAFCIPTSDIEDPDKHAPYQEGGAPNVKHDTNTQAFKEKYNKGKHIVPKKPAGYDPKNKVHQDAFILELEKRGVPFDKWDSIGEAMKGKSITVLDTVLKDFK